MITMAHDIDVGEVSPPKNEFLQIPQAVNLNRYRQSHTYQIHRKPGIFGIGPGFTPQGSRQKTQNHDKGQMRGPEGVRFERSGIGDKHVVNAEGYGQQADKQLKGVVPNLLFPAQQPFQDALFFLFLVIKFLMGGAQILILGRL